MRLRAGCTPPPALLDTRAGPMVISTHDVSEASMNGEDGPLPSEEPDVVSQESGSELPAEAQPEMDLEALLGTEFEAWLRHFGAC